LPSLDGNAQLRSSLLRIPERSASILEHTHMVGVQQKRAACKAEAPRALASSAACVTCHDVAAPGGLRVRVTIKPSTRWLAADLQQLGSLVQQRNQFVCLQLVTMASEQLASAAAAAAVGDAHALHAAALTFLATVVVPTHDSDVLAAGMFRVRARGGATATEAQDCPHVYVELVACNSPGRGLGTCLLQAIEAFVSENRHALSVGCACGAQGEAPEDPRGACKSTAQQQVQQQQAQQELQDQEQRVKCPDLPSHDGAAATGQQQGCDARPSPSNNTTSSVTSAGVTTRSSGGMVTISGIKLLSIASAQGFYRRCGYLPPDAACEMFKPLHALHHHHLA
jgi:hypothetical protein